MFIGHFGVGFGAKAAEPRLSLGTLFFASQFVDLLWPTLLLLGVERVAIVPGITKVTPLDFIDYPISHSLFFTLLWGLLFGLVYWLLRKNVKGALVLGLCVISHWLLDLLVHRPDLPLYPGDSMKVGLGLWNSLPATLLLEGAIFAVGVVLYSRVTQATGRAGSYGLWGLVGFLVLIQLANVFGPPPEEVMAIAWVGQAQWLLVAWAYWVDRNRLVRTSTA